MKILLIEDNQRIARLISKGLKAQAYVVDLAYDGETGFDLATTEKYSLIIVDLMIPKINGIDLVKKLRQEKSETPILILTAKGQTEDKVNGLDAGADDYLVKPFFFDELLARIRALTRRQKPILPDEIKYKNLVLNRKTFEIKKENKLIYLTKKEFLILEYLLKNKGQVVSKTELIENVWDYDADILFNTVEVFIKKIRRKIDNQNEQSIIKTVKGFGYKIE